MISHHVVYTGDKPSPAGPDYPTPSGDQSSPTVDISDIDFSGDGHNPYNTGWADIFWKLVNAMNGDQNDVAQSQLFDKYFIELAAHPDALNQLTALLGTQKGGFDLNGFMDYFSQNEVMLATIYGYPGHPGAGLDSGNAWIATELAKYEALPPSSFRDHMITNLQSLQQRLPSWYADHWHADLGKFEFDFTSPDTGIVTKYYLDPKNKDDTRDTAMIYLLTACGGITGQTNQFWNSFDSSGFDVTYELQILDSMIKKGDSYIMIYLALLMMKSDGTYSDMNGTKSAINRTNNMIDRQTALSKFFHPGATNGMTKEDAQAYAEGLLDTLTIVDVDGTFSSQQQQYVTGSIIPALNTVVDETTDPKTTLGDMINAAETSGKPEDWQKLADKLNALPTQSPPSGYQSLKDAMSAGNDQFSQLSKTEGVISSTDNTKIGQYTNSLSDSAKAWLDFITYELQHQTS